MCLLEGMLILGNVAGGRKEVTRMGRSPTKTEGPREEEAPGGDSGVQIWRKLPSRVHMCLIGCGLALTIICYVRLGLLSYLNVEPGHGTV